MFLDLSRFVLKIKRTRVLTGSTNLVWQPEVIRNWGLYLQKQVIWASSRDARQPIAIPVRRLS